VQLAVSQNSKQKRNESQQGILRSGLRMWLSIPPPPPRFQNPDLHLQSSAAARFGAALPDPDHANPKSLAKRSKRDARHPAAPTRARGTLSGKPIGWYVCAVYLISAARVYGHGHADFSGEGARFPGRTMPRPQDFAARGGV
jgi:hypothetical protein